MKKYGDIVPTVGCFHHVRPPAIRALNLSVGGRLYESEARWESGQIVDYQTSGITIMAPSGPKSPGESGTTTSPPVIPGKP